MNCAKCLNDRSSGRRSVKVTPKRVALVKTGEHDGEEKFECPKCYAIFWFPKPQPDFMQPSLC